MTRRSFLKNIAGALAVLALPVAVKTAAEKRVGMYDHLFEKKPWPPNLGAVQPIGRKIDVYPYPPRFNYDEETETFVRVWPPVIESVGPQGRFCTLNPAWVDAEYEEQVWEMPRIFA